MSDLMVKPVDVLGDTIMAAQDGEGTIWVGVRWMCQGMGMSDGQYKRQIKNIQKDLLLKNSGSNLNLNKGSGERDVFCLKLDYLPIWLAKISITPTIQKDHPELADKLLEYQLKAKDILAAAFLPQQNMPQTTDGKIALLAQGHTELKAEVDSIREDLESLKMDLPILPIEADKITEAVRKKGVAVLGGKQSNAYNNRGLRQRLYNDLYSNLKYNFGVKSYKSIKRSQCDKAIEVIQKYEPPFFLTVMIDNENSQHTMTWKEMLGDE